MKEHTGRGRPKKQYDQEVGEQIQCMSQYGMGHEEIAARFNMSANTMRKLYRRELDEGMFLAKLAVGKKLFERCMAGDVACLIFYAKTRLGWREKDKADTTQEDKAARLAEALRNAFKSVG